MATLTTVTATLLVALLYTAGWLYALQFFFRFHLGLMTLGLPREAFLLYGAGVAVARWYWVGLPVLMMRE